MYTFARAWMIFWGRFRTNKHATLSLEFPGVSKPSYLFLQHWYHVCKDGSLTINAIISTDISSWAWSDIHWLIMSNKTRWSSRRYQTFQEDFGEPTGLFNRYLGYLTWKREPLNVSYIVDQSTDREHYYLTLRTWRLYYMTEICHDRFCNEHRSSISICVWLQVFCLVYDRWNYNVVLISFYVLHEKYTVPSTFWIHGWKINH